MSLMINDEPMAAKLIADRRDRGLDGRDEVWNGVYMMSPLADNEHQELATELAAILRSVVDWQGQGKTLMGANLSDRQEDWTSNYRVPDLLMIRRHSTAIDCGSHWRGGPDLVIEIVSRGDRTLEKLEFYATVGTRELLVVDRDPWRLTLYRPDNVGKLVPVAESSPAQTTTISLDTAPLNLELDHASRCLRVKNRDDSLIREIAIRVR
jgi:Uma2 family endonuclease